jgi:hypothetical protein
MKAVSCLLLLTALVLCQGVFGHYVLMREGFRKCYLIEVPKDTLIWGNFQCEPEGLIAGVNPLVERGIGIIVEVVDPIERTVYSRVSDNNNSNITWMYYLSWWIRLLILFHYCSFYSILKFFQEIPSKINILTTTPAINMPIIHY